MWKYFYKLRKMIPSRAIIRPELPHNNESQFKLIDYDCVGFDLDNTLLRYKIFNTIHMEYEVISKYLVNEHGYCAKHLLQPLDDDALDFMQKGLFLDFERGNILKMRSDGIIHKVHHGTNVLSDDKIEELYPNRRWSLADVLMKDPMSTWNGPMSLKIRSSLDYFDIFVPLIFGRIIDSVDKENGNQSSKYDIWPQILQGLMHLYSRKECAGDAGTFFPIVQQEPEKFLYKCNAQTLTWLEKLHQNCFTFLITGSDASYTNFVANYAIGENWRSYFDIVICFARKPGFFVCENPFFAVDNQEESTNVVPYENLERGGIYNRGNWKGLTTFFSRQLDKPTPKCLYMGDNLVQDIHIPHLYSGCDTIAIIEEQSHQVSIEDKKILNSKVWGSFFGCIESERFVDSYWGDIVKSRSKICVPTLDTFAQLSIEEPISCFHHNNEYDGYYPARPLDIPIIHKIESYTKN